MGSLARKTPPSSAFQRFRRREVGLIHISTAQPPNLLSNLVTAFNYNLRFPGQYALNESGLFYNYFRDYDPQTGRYIESDPVGLGAGVNTYAYVGGNPFWGFDPFGLYDPALPWQVGWEWLTGTGPRSHNFTDGDPFTEILRQHDHIRNLVNKVCRGAAAPSGADPYQLSGLKGVPEFIDDYSAVYTDGQSGNLAAAYLGSYALHYSFSNGSVELVVDNTSNMGSATHPPVIGYTPWWERNVASKLNHFFATGAMSATTQHFDFHQKCACGN
jgi:RHS repeat-associated protein